MQHLVSVDDLSHDFIFELFERAAHFKQLRLNGSVRAFHWDDIANLLRNRLMMTMFFQPSTRTRLSFEAAMSYLGGKVVGTENAEEFSSFKKGGTIEDEFRVISGYCDIIVGRFKHPGEARIAAAACDVPLINGGDGTGEHPTQALLDLFTIIEKFPNPESLTITFVGDNRRSRTVQSLARMLAGFGTVTRMNFVALPEIQIYPAFRDDLQNRNDQLVVDLWDSLDYPTLSTSDVVYVTRSQNEYGAHMLNGLVFDHAAMLPENAIILHPLPRNSELPTSVDTNPRAYYFEQARNGLYVRMALLEALCQRRRG